MKGIKIDTFHNNENGYLAWHKDHRQSFVLNRFGGKNPAFNVLHRSDCTFLWREVDDGSRTAVEKWCSESEEELRQQADTLLGRDMWKKCGVCFRTPRSPEMQTPNPRTVVTSTAFERDLSQEIEPLWVAGEPAVWLGSGEKEWKHKVTTAFKAIRSDGFPQWMDVEFRFLDERLYRKDIDNLLTPVLESARDGGWIERGFAWLGSVTARKVVVANPSEVGVMITPLANPPVLMLNRVGVLIEAALPRLDESTIKWTLYESAFDLYKRCPRLRFAPLSPLSVEIRVAIDDAGRRKSIKELLKPCIDGLEPILGHPDNLLPESRETLQRRLAPQDEMILSLSFHVRGGDSNEISALVSPHQPSETQPMK